MQAHNNLSGVGKCQYCPRCRKMRLTIDNLPTYLFTLTESLTEQAAVI